jgi:hypothetical protein
MRRLQVLFDVLNIIGISICFLNKIIFIFADLYKNMIKSL